MTVPIEGDASATAETGPTPTSEAGDFGTPQQNQNQQGTLVKTPGMLSSFSCPDETFPTITPKGVHMNDEQLKAAKAAAKAARVKLVTDRGQR